MTVKNGNRFRGLNIDHDGDHWWIMGCGYEDVVEGKIYCHLASKTRSRDQGNGPVPIQIQDYLDIDSLEALNDRRNQERVDFSTSSHYGDIGSKYQLGGLMVVSVKSVNSIYGNSLMVKLADPVGNLFTLFYSGGTWKPVKSHIYNLTAWVKKHEEFRGVESTTITRPSKIELIN